MNVKLTTSLAVMAAFAVPSVSSAISASHAYVQRGLVAQYDGIDNAGTGSHDASATTWKNLTGDTSLDGSCANELSWGDKGWTVSGDCKPVTLGTGIAQVISKTNCTIEVACKPSVVNKRVAYFSQYNGSTGYGGISLENTTDGKFRLFRTRTTSVGDYNWTDITPAATANTFVSFAFALANKYPKFYKDGNYQATTTAAWGEASASTESVIGSEVQRSGRSGSSYTSGYGITFQGTYHAFRVYNVTLTAAEIAWNAGLDAVRFNGADAAATLGAEYSYDAATDTLTASFAPTTGTDAADGLMFDLSFTGDKTADGLTFSSSNADEKQGYETNNVALPVLPTVTNANTTCLYFPTPSDTSDLTVYRQDTRKANAAVMGQVATVFCRFRWDGAVLPSKVNYPTLIANGYTSWSAYPTEGFMLRLRSDANSSQAQFSLVVPGLAVSYNTAAITKTGTPTINAGRWVDVFASVYPSPTDPTLSNADIWFCEVPSWTTNGYFKSSEIGHYHFADGCAIPRMFTATQKTIIFGSEPGAVATPLTWTSKDDNAVKCFRGAIACAKGWNRLLSENEMFTVMAGFGGVQTFADLETRVGCTVETGTLTTQEGKNVTDTAFLGDADTTHFKRSLTTTYDTIRLVFDAPKGDKTYPFVYKTKISGVKTGNTHPIHLDFNGKTVWSSENAATGTEISVELSDEDALPGLNELTWHYDTPVANNWITFQKHWLRLLTPDKPFVITVK